MKIDTDWILPVVSGALEITVKAISRGGALFFCLGAIHYTFTNVSIKEPIPILGNCLLAGLMWGLNDK